MEPITIILGGLCVILIWVAIQLTSKLIDADVLREEISDLKEEVEDLESDLEDAVLAKRRVKKINTQLKLERANMVSAYEGLLDINSGLKNDIEKLTTPLESVKTETKKVKVSSKKRWRKPGRKTKIK